MASPPKDANKLSTERLNEAWRKTWYAIVRTLMAWLVRFKYDVKVVGKEKLPATSGGFIIASNHLSNWDPPLVALAATPICISFMAKKELFEIPVLGHAIYHLCAFSVNRQKLEVATIRSAKAVMKHSDWVLGMFPEGTRKNQGELTEAKKGIGVLAAMGKLPVLPFGVTRGGPNNKHFCVAVGDMVPYQPKENSEAYAQRIHEGMMKAKQQSLEALEAWVYPGSK